MTYTRIGKVEKVTNDNGTYLFHQKGGNKDMNNQKQNNEGFKEVLKEKMEVEIPHFPEQGKMIMVIEQDGREHIADTVPNGAKFLYSSRQFNVYQGGIR